MKKLQLIQVCIIVSACYFSFGVNAASERVRNELAHQRNVPVDEKTGQAIPNIAQHETEFKLFWKKFRKAIMLSDWDKLNQYVKFPLKSKGREKYDPDFDITKNDFKIVFAQFIKNEVALITELKEVNPYITGDWVNILDMQFSRQDGTWKLYFIYISL